jgi:hypothetical protein
MSFIAYQKGYADCIYINFEFLAPCVQLGVFLLRLLLSFHFISFDDELELARTYSRSGRTSLLRAPFSPLNYTLFRRQLVLS